jgi:hypothetical protein
MEKFLVKTLALAVMTAGLSACGSSSDDAAPVVDPGPGKVVVNGNISANPDFTFDQTTYVGAVDPAATNAWWGFALAGSIPSSAAVVDVTTGTDASFNPVVTFAPSMAGITAAAACPSGSGTYQVVDAEADVMLDGQTFKKCLLTGTISANVTLNNDVVWSLDGRVNVGDGNRALTSTDKAVRDVTLTIEKGTIFHSVSKSSLVVTRGAKINAVGTEAQPIVMAGEATSTYDGNGEWGGLVLQGFGYDNNCGDPKVETICNIEGEGASGTFGGFDNADNSGSLKYVIVTEAGDQLGNGDELNGIGFMGVGYGTDLDYIQVHNNFDDGVELWGGAADLKHLVLTSIKDDSIDWDEGYVGNIQYALIVQTQNQDNAKKGKYHAFELDTAGDASESAYQESNPTVANVTAIASLSAAEANGGDGIHLKKGSEGQFFNILLLGDYRNCVYIDDNTSLTSYTTTQDALVNVYGLCNNAVDVKDSGFTVGIETATTMLNDNLAYNVAVTATIASKEVDGTAPAL